TPAARRGPGLCAVRPRRLARPAVGHRADRRRAGDGHPRPGGTAGAVPVRTGPGCAGLRHRVRRGGRHSGQRGGPMKAFAELYAQLDSTTSSNAKLHALQAYFSQAEPADAAWAVYFLAGGKPRQLVPTRLLRELATRHAQLPEWLCE